MSGIERVLIPRPTDGISSIVFSPSTSQFLLASSWDSNVYLYDTSAPGVKQKYQHKSAVLDVAFLDGSHSYSGGLDCDLLSVDLATGNAMRLGSHDEAIKCVEYSSDVRVIVTGSWDSTVKIWDPNTMSCVGSYSQPDKVYTMSLCGEQIIVGTAGRKVMIWDLRNMQYVQQRRESSLKYQTRCIRAFPNREAYVLASIEGRVAVEYINPSPEVQKKKYAFKCHRIKEDGVEYIYPVNALAFHTHHNTFATGGADGYVNIWDGFNKKRLCQFHRYPTSISSLSFSSDGRHLAVASSYNGEIGSVDNKPPDEIYVRSVSDAETKPK